MNNETQPPLAINVPVLAFNLKNGSITQCDNYIHAAEFFGLSWDWFLVCLCTDKFKTHHHNGFIFKFNNDEPFKYLPIDELIKLPLHEKPITFSIENKETNLVRVCDLDQIEHITNIPMDVFEEARGNKFHFTIGKFFFKQRNGFDYNKDKNLTRDEIFTVSNIQRFLKYIKLGHPKGCVEWTGGITSKGYGSFRIIGKNRQRSYSAHKFAFELATGGIILDSHIKICHKCDNPKCVLVTHMVLGTHKYNMLDMKKKNRTNSRYTRRKLTAEMAKEIKYSSLSYKEAAAKYGIAPSTVKDIRLGRRWKNV